MPVDGAGRGILYRQHAVVGLARLDRGEDTLEGMAREVTTSWPKCWRKACSE